MGNEIMTKSYFLNKTVVITGSTRGIGLGIAQHFYNLGANVVINGTNPQNFKKISNNFDTNRSVFIQSDVTSSTGAMLLVQKTIDYFGKIDILICNVGSGSSVALGSETYDEWQRVFNLNFFSTTNMIEAAKDYLIDFKSKVLCISSICGIDYIKGAPATYSVAKSALNSYVKMISKFYGPKGVVINAIALGNIDFPDSVWQRKLNENPSEVSKTIANEVALQRLGNLNDVVSWVEWLTSPFSSFSNGATYVVDGGQIV